VALLALGVGTLKLKDRFLAQHPEKFVAAGREALDRKDYSAARDNLLHAAALSHPDAPLDVLIGDALNGLASKDPDNVAAARGMWEQALTVDPLNEQAMQRLTQFWRDQLELHPRPSDRAQAASNLQKAAEKLMHADPSNHFAQVNDAEATVEMMLDGMQMDAQVSQDAEDLLLKLAADDPADAEIPYYAARGYYWQAQQASRFDDSTSQAANTARAEKIMDDAVKIQPANAAMHYRYGKLLLYIAAGKMANAQEKEKPPQ